MTVNLQKKKNTSGQNWHQLLRKSCRKWPFILRKSLVEHTEPPGGQNWAGQRAQGAERGWSWCQKEPRSFWSCAVTIPAWGHVANPGEGGAQLRGAPGGSLLCPWSCLGQGSSLDSWPWLCPLLVATVPPETSSCTGSLHRHCFKIWAQLTMGSTQSRNSASFHSLGHPFVLSGKGEFTTMS